MTTQTAAPAHIVMASAAEIAERDGISKQAVTRKVRELADNHGLEVNRDGRGRIVSFNKVQYDHLRGQYGDPSKAQAPALAGSDEAAAQNDSYDEALRQKTWTEAEKRRLELAELKGELVPTRKVAEAASRCAEEVVRIAESLKNQADDMSAAVGRDGPHGLRVLLKQIVEQQREAIADAFARIPEEVAKNAGGGRSVQ